jgi:predicted Zn-dependent peptidase
MALRIFPEFIYGEGHAYSQPLTGSGYEDDVAELSREDMLKFYDTWIKPNNSTLVVVGDLEMSMLKEKAETLFRNWKAGNVPKKNISTVSGIKPNKLYLMDRPESEQSVIIAGYVTHPYGKISEYALQSLMNVFGGDFVSRINMNIREDKHWSYGAGAVVLDAKGQRPMLVYTSVQKDKSKESIEELIREYREIVGDRPVTGEEFERVKNNMVMQLPGQWETNGSVLSSVGEMVTYDLPQNYYQQYDRNVRALSLEEVHSVSEKVIESDKLTWFVVGDQEKILPSLEKLAIDEIIFVDPDGNPLEPTGDIDPVVK